MGLRDLDICNKNVIQKRRKKKKVQRPIVKRMLCMLRDSAKFEPPLPLFLLFFAAYLSFNCESYVLFFSSKIPLSPPPSKKKPLFPNCFGLVCNPFMSSMLKMVNIPSDDRYSIN